jgi:hypothetical protein
MSEYLALPDGPGRFPQGFTSPAVLRIPLSLFGFRLPDFHRLWSAFPGRSANFPGPVMWSYDPKLPLLVTWFRLFRFRSPLLAESRLFSLPPGTEMVHFPGFASPSYGFRWR